MNEIIEDKGEMKDCYISLSKIMKVVGGRLYCGCGIMTRPNLEFYLLDLYNITEARLV